MIFDKLVGWFWEISFVVLKRVLGVREPNRLGGLWGEGACKSAVVPWFILGVRRQTGPHVHIRWQHDSAATRGREVAV